MFTRLSTSHSPSGGGGPHSKVGEFVSSVFHHHSSPSSQPGLSVSGHVKNVLNRYGLTLYEKVYELARLLEPCLSASPSAERGRASRHQQHHQTSSSSSFSVKDLDSIFLLLIGDVFGSQAARAPKYGPGWNLLGLTRSRQWRDYHAALTFLGSSGVLSRLSAALGDSGVNYDFPVSRLPFRTGAGSVVSPGSPLNLLSDADSAQHHQEFVSLSPFEYYLYHFVALVNQTCETTYGAAAPGGVVDGESLYPVLFEDYLSAHLPVGGENFKYHEMAAGLVPRSPPAATTHQHTQVVNPARPSLFRSDIRNLTSSPLISSEAVVQAPAGSASSPFSAHHHHHYQQHHHLHLHHPHMETWRSFALVDTITKFWVLGWCEEADSASATSSSPSATTATLRIPSGDVVKMLRMFIKHVHYFLNSLHVELQDSLRQSLFADFFPSLLRLLSFLFDHWPLDGSFRLVLETWASAIQPWRYRESPSGGDENALSVFYPGPWEAFLSRYADFYNKLFQRLLAKFFRLDLASSKNAFMLFRVAKVMSQEGLPETLKAVLSKNLSPVRAATASAYIHSTGDGVSSEAAMEHALRREFKSIFDDAYKPVVEALLLRAKEAWATVQDRRASLADGEDPLSDSYGYGDGGQKDVFVALWDWAAVTLFGDGMRKSSPEEEELERTTQNLESAEQRLAQIFGVSLDQDDLARIVGGRTGDVDDGDLQQRARRRRLGGQYLSCHDEDTPMTPQKRWEIVNRASRYSPKYRGHPDEAPLRSDEFHWLARKLYSLSQFLNSRLPVESVYARDDLVGVAAAQVLREPTTYRAKNANAGTVEVHSLPARLSLRPLASHAAVAYLVAFLFLAWVSRSFAGKLVFLGFTLWMVVLVANWIRRKHGSARSFGDSGRLQRRRLIDMDETLND